ncbi:hypothetical protein MSG28_005479 [Choristoneura fumiferana]|uniref:Uncharacterized protein n=1 Tax=Choristoneura fumiferana TaxID=7141 RepID=A0ACC0KZ84_CHOFU|nr:hypothetical protein MSG28_005479 [Choristoneura fumiferana]
MDVDELVAELEASVRRLQLRCESSSESRCSSRGHHFRDVWWQFCGGVIAGLCLVSDAVMRLAHETHKHLALDALLQRRCLYIMSGVSRYEFTHAVLGGEDSVWRAQRVPRRRRVAVILRSRPPPQPQP